MVATAGVPESMMIQGLTTAFTLAAALTALLLTTMQFAVEVPGYSPTARFYVTLVGSLLGWSIMATAGLTQIYSQREYPPIFTGLVFALGVAFVFIFNEFIVRDVAVSIVLKVLGFMLVAGAVVGVTLYRHGRYSALKETANSDT